MSKGGGAGKVYFVLYLAVVLELLIIIVERDEAEEHLLKKQRETMKIVESILSQLQSGAGTEGINTRPQDEITIPPADINVKEVLGADVKSYRTYIVDVGVTDISSDIKKRPDEQQVEYAKRLDKLIKLGNVEEIEYQIFFNSSQDPNNAPPFLTEEEILKNNYDFTKFQPGQSIQNLSGDSWEFLSLRKIKLDAKAIMNGINDFNNVTVQSLNPIYPKDKEVFVGPSYSPRGKEDSVFFYYQKDPKVYSSAAMLKRSFVVNFEPPRRAGWYKLRFASRTNRILGVHGELSPDNIPDDANINIGTVSLTAKDLKKVLKELNSKLERYSPPTFELLAKEKNIDAYEAQLAKAIEKANQDSDNPTEAIGNLRLYDYVIRLLTPGQSSNFAQNRGSIEFNVRVILPEVKAAKPELVMPTYTPTFDKLAGVFEFTAAPWMGSNQIEGRVVDATNSNVARINFKAMDEINSALPKPISGGKRDYMATVDQVLSPGKYEMIVTHRIGGQVKEERGTLEVFPTELTKNNNDLTNARMEMLYYGEVFPLMSFEPSAGGKIRPENFRVYIINDRDVQKSPIKGLSITRDNSYIFDCNVNTASLKVTWVQPYTDQEVELYNSGTKKVKQKAPTINTSDISVSTDEVGTNRLRITIRNIRIVAPSDGKTETSQADLIVDADKRANLGTLTGQGVEQFSDVTIVKDGSTYKLEFTVNVNLAKGIDMINGIANVRVLARARNTCNPEIVSNQESRTVNALIKYEPPKGGRGGRGGAQQPQGGSQPRGGRR